MLSINLIPLLTCATLISVLLIILNRLRVGVAGSIAATISLCFVVAFVGFHNFSTGVAVRQAILYWLVLLCLPSSVVFGLSRSDLFRRNVWWLLLAGPISFIVTVVVAVGILHIFIPSALSP